MKIYPPPPSARRKYPEPLKHVLSSSLAVLDPNSSRTRLFDRSNPDCPQPGDILLATFTPDNTPASFSGVCLSIRRQGIDTAVLLRNRLMTTSVEMWVKVYSPKVKAIEVVEKTPKRARRARLYYMRKPKHDRGSVEGVVEEYLKRRRLVRSGDMGVPGVGKGKIGGGKGGRAGGKTR
ncbi:MAG: hypothetical protein LQ351_004264 [Letrouitia transgressa]|nr:MAG: hypothetical protein LQ351_004264 [Letrouitia transgressa]